MQGNVFGVGAMLEAGQVVWGFDHSIKAGSGIVVYYDHAKTKGIC